MDGRVKHVDIAKGISISLVAMLHSELRTLFPDFVEGMGLFRMPLFFALSGLFFSYAAKPKPFLLNKADALLKPYFVVLLCLLLIAAWQGESDILWRLKGIFYASGATIDWGPLWFLPHLFLVYCFTYILFRYCGFSRLPRWISLLLLTVFLAWGAHYVAYFWHSDLVLFSSNIHCYGLPFSLDIIPLSLFYFMLGVLFKQPLLSFKAKPVLGVISLLVVIVIATCTETRSDFYMRLYQPVLFATIAALAGFYFVLTVSWFICRSPLVSVAPLALGKASLYILIFHSFISRQVYAYISKGFSNATTLVLLAITAYACSITVPLVIKVLVEKSAVLSLAFRPCKLNPLFVRDKSAN